MINKYINQQHRDERVAQELGMNQKDEFSRWISAVDEALSPKSAVKVKENYESGCDCGNWDCQVCFPSQDDVQSVGQGELSFDSYDDYHECPVCGHECSGHSDEFSDIEFEVTPSCNSDQYDDEYRESAGGMGAGAVAVNEGESENEIGKIETDPEEMINAISYMQDIGLSKSDQHYDISQLQSLQDSQLRQIYDEVIGEVSEATKPTKTKTNIDFDFGDDILNPHDASLPAEIDSSDDSSSSNNYNDDQLDLPTASRTATQNRLRGMTPTDTMRDFMNRINPDAGATEPELPPPGNDVVVRTARDVPVVISTAMRATGFETPEWHTINNLPGYQERNIRGMGRQLFGMFTRTPLEQIKTIANVGGQGPNTSQEVRAVAAWLRDNAEDLGEVQVDHGIAIPGYRPDVKEFRIRGVRFHVVRDPIGEYIYAYPDSDARLAGGQGQQNQLGRGGNIPRLRESTKLKVFKPSLLEQIRWDKEIDRVLRESMVEEEEMLYESTLSKLLGRKPGAKLLVKWLHTNYRLSDVAQIEPAKMSDKRLMWGSFKSNPDQFIIVICRPEGNKPGGVAGIKPNEQDILDAIEKDTKAGKSPDSIDWAKKSNIKYEFAVFTDDGEEIPNSAFNQWNKEKSKGKDKDDTAAGKRDPRVVKMRMGVITGRDNQNPNNVFNYLNDTLGPIQSVYVTGEQPDDPAEEQPRFKPGVEREKIGKRAELRGDGPLKPDSEVINDIFKKVRPVLKTIGAQALSQIHRSSQRYINGGNFEAAQKLMRAGANLQKTLVSLDTTGNISLSQTGNSRELYNAIVSGLKNASGANIGTPEFNKWANEAARGNSASLKPILDALRDSFVNIPDYL